MKKIENTGEALPLRVEFDPPNPKAGEEFKIIVILNRPVEQQPLTLGFEKQRFKFIPKPGEFPVLRPTGGNYFAIDPTNFPVRVEVGKDSGESRASVRPDAIDGDTGDPILFPDNLVLTYFAVLATASGMADRYCIGIVKIGTP